jgi:mannose-6-phosphate isomerase-like protein (cupin superfamily)
MTEQIVVRGPGEGRTLLVGGGDYVTYKTTSAETGGDFFSFEISTVPGFGPPMHKHAYRELFYVLEGSYEFTVADQPDGLRTIDAVAGTSVTVSPDVPHTFRNASGQPARMLCVQQHATLEGFFEEFGVPLSPGGDTSIEAEPPDFEGMAAALERNGVTVLGAPGAPS